MVCSRIVVTNHIYQAKAQVLAVEVLVIMNCTPVRQRTCCTRGSSFVHLNNGGGTLERAEHYRLVLKHSKFVALLNEAIHHGKRAR